MRRDARIRLVRNQKPLGTAHTLAYGVLSASSRVIARLDSDDSMSRSRLEIQLEELMSRSLSLVGSNVYFMDGRSRVIGRSNVPLDHEAIGKWLRRGQNPFYAPSTMFLRDDVLSVGNFNCSQTRAEDFELWCRTWKALKTGNLAQPLTYYRQHQQQSSASKVNEAKFLCLMSVRTHFPNSRSLATGLRARQLDDVDLQNLSVILTGQGAASRDGRSEIQALTEVFTRYLDHRASEGSRILHLLKSVCWARSPLSAFGILRFLPHVRLSAIRTFLRF